MGLWKGQEEMFRRSTRAAWSPSREQASAQANKHWDGAFISSAGTGYPGTLFPSGATFWSEKRMGKQ